MQFQIKQSGRTKLGSSAHVIQAELLEEGMIDETIERMADAVMELQQSGNVAFPALRKQLKDTQKGIGNMLDAIQQGITSASTKQRLDELEAAKEKLEISILQEEMQKPPLTREQVVFWISRLKEGNIKTINSKAS